MREWRLRDDVVEKDYVLGWILWGIGADAKLQRYWVFKGGTCLKKCYIETYRFSEDLDFTVLPGGPVAPEDVERTLVAVLGRVAERSGLELLGRSPRLRQRPNGSTEGRVYYRGPRNAPTAASVKLDLTADESVVRPPVLREIAHSHSDRLPSPATIRCYGFEELFAEKLRAMGERCRSRDLYDVINLFRRRDLRAHPRLIRDVLIKKCQTKEVPVPTMDLLEGSRHRAEVEAEWANMLAHQLPALPPFGHFWGELPSLFEWLDGTELPVWLPAIPLGSNEEPDWRPPAVASTWKGPASLEVVRFAAANHLCVRLGYGGKQRLIEPYSLRRTKAGNLLLHAIRVEDREHRAYRVDRIESVRASTRPFKPVHAVEFTPTGHLHSPPQRQPRRS